MIPQCKAGNALALTIDDALLVFDGRVGEAMAVSRKALALDPLAPLINMNVGWTYFAAGFRAAPGASLRTFYPVSR